MLGSFKFAKEAVRRTILPEDNVCVATTATCGPPAHPCETCMHLRGVKKVTTAEKDLCLIAPRNLVKPVQYRRYFNRGIHLPPYLPASKVDGELKEIKVLDPCSPEMIENHILSHRQREIDRRIEDVDDISTPYLISHNVYIEHNGRFTKAPKHLLELGDYTTRTCYLEDVAGPEFRTPLDLAIFTQKVWTSGSKIILGLLGGVALMQLSLVIALVPTVQGDLNHFFRVYSSVCYAFNTFISVFMVIAVVAMFDWMDLAHMNLQHIWDTYVHRTIWIICLPFLLAFILMRLNSRMDDMIYLNGYRSSNDLARAEDSLSYGQMELRSDVYAWQVKCLAKNAFIIIAWSLLVMTRNDDLFLLHLQCMKKYDYNPEMRVHRQELMNPHLNFQGP